MEPSWISTVIIRKITTNRFCGSCQRSTRKKLSCDFLVFPIRFLYAGRCSCRCIHLHEDSSLLVFVHNTFVTTRTECAGRTKARAKMRSTRGRFFFLLTRPSSSSIEVTELEQEHEAAVQRHAERASSLPALRVGQRLTKSISHQEGLGLTSEWKSTGNFQSTGW